MNPNHHPALAAELTRRIAPNFPGIRPAHLLEDVEVEVFNPTDHDDATHEAIIHCAYEAESGYRDDRWGYITYEHNVKEWEYAETSEDLVDTLTDLIDQHKTFHLVEVPQDIADEFLRTAQAAA